MKQTRRFLSIVTAMSLLSATTFAAETASDPKPGGEKIQVVVATGGHGFDREGFIAMWDSFEGMDWKEVQQKKSKEVLDPKYLEDCDVLVLYDMLQPVTDEQKQALLDFLKRGGGLIALHHSIASHQDWPDYERIIGGLYMFKELAEKRGVEPSGYEHDVTLNVHVAAPDHPVTEGIEDFKIQDEIYWNYAVDPKVHVLLTTDHPQSGRKLAWVRQEGKGRVVFIQLGHDNHAFSHPAYRRLISNAVQWTAKPNDK